MAIGQISVCRPNQKRSTDFRVAQHQFTRSPVFVKWHPTSGSPSFRRSGSRVGTCATELAVCRIQSRKIIAMRTEQEAASLAVLKRVPIFSSLSDQEFAFLTSHVLQRKFSSGEIIFGEG